MSDMRFLKSAKTVLIFSVMVLCQGHMLSASALSVDDFSTGFYILSSVGDLVNDTGPCGCVSTDRTASLQSNVPGESSVSELVGGEAFLDVPAGGAYFSLEYNLSAPLDLTQEGDSLDIAMRIAVQGAYITVTLSDGFSNAGQTLITESAINQQDIMRFPLSYFNSVNLQQITGMKVEFNSTFPGSYYFTDITVDFTAMADVNWSRSLNLQTTGGIEHPMVRVGFTPQPEPPGHWLPGLNLNDPTQPIISLTGDTLDTLQFFVAVDPSSSEPFISRASGVPDAAGHFEFEMEGPSSALTIILDITSSSMGIVAPGTWEGFTPQPEPPGFPVFMGQQQGFSFDMAYGKETDRKAPDTFYVAMQILEEGTPYNFSEVTLDVPAMSPWSMIVLLLVFSGLIPARMILRRRNRNI